jgi:hypothetical protein
MLTQCPLGAPADLVWSGDGTSKHSGGRPVGPQVDHR